MVKQKLERQLEFDFMKEVRPFQFGIKDILGLTTYFSIGLSFYSSYMHYIKPVDNDTPTSQLFYFFPLFSIGMGFAYFTKEFFLEIQDSVKNSR